MGVSLKGIVLFLTYLLRDIKIHWIFEKWASLYSQCGELSKYCLVNENCRLCVCVLVV